MREKVRIGHSLARSPYSQTVKNSPLSTKITLAEMLANIYTARRRHILKMTTIKELSDASPTRARPAGAAGAAACVRSSPAPSVPGEHSYFETNPLL